MKGKKERNLKQGNTKEGQPLQKGGVRVWMPDDDSAQAVRAEQARAGNTRAGQTLGELLQGGLRWRELQQALLFHPHKLSLYSALGELLSVPTIRALRDEGGTVTHRLLQERLQALAQSGNQMWDKPTPLTDEDGSQVATGQSVELVRRLRPHTDENGQHLMVASVYGFGRYVPCTFSFSPRGELLAWFAAHAGHGAAMPYPVETWEGFMDVWRDLAAEGAAPLNVLRGD